MKSVRRKILVNAMCAVCMGAALPAAAQMGANAYSWLEVASSTRAQALGGYAIACTAPDAMLADGNPALLGPEAGTALGLGYMRWFGSSNFAAARYSHAAGERGAWSAGIRYLDFGQIDSYQPDGSFIGTFKPQDIVGEATYSHDFTDRLRGGIAGKIIYSNYEEYTAWALAADLGLNYYDDEHDLSLSAVMKNAGGQIKRFNETYDHLPFDIQLGYMQGLGEGPFSLAVTAHHLTKWKMTYYEHGDNDDSSSLEEAGGGFVSDLFRHLAFGLQYQPSDRFYIAAGYNYKTRTDMASYQRNFLSGVSLGMGIEVSDFSIGISYSQPHKSASTIGLNVSYLFP